MAVVLHDVLVWYAVAWCCTVLYGVVVLHGAVSWCDVEHGVNMKRLHLKLFRLLNTYSSGLQHGFHSVTQTLHPAGHGGEVVAAGGRGDDRQRTKGGG